MKSESKPTSGGFRVYLGTIPNYADQSDGMKLDGVRSGSGTLADPYVISGYAVSGSLYLGDTDACVTITGNYIDGELALNWNGNCVHVHHNFIRDLRVNENVAREGYDTGGLIELNQINYVGQIRHYDGEFRDNVVGPREDAKLPFGVFQDPENQIVATVVEEDVAFGPENLGLPRAEIRERVADAMRRLEIEDLRQRAPHQLSGGQKQRVAIAGVIAMRPAVLVLDESTAMLDPSGRAEVLQAAQALHRDGVTVVAITHFMSEVVLADRVIVLAEGRVALEAAPRALFAQPDRLRALEMEVPQVTEIAARLRSRGMDVGLVPLTVAELADAYVRMPR